MEKVSEDVREKLTLDEQETPSLGAAAPQHQEDQPVFPGPPDVPQLPPQMFTTAAQLLDLTDS